MNKKNINDLIRVFEGINRIQIPNKKVLVEHVTTGILIESKKTEELSITILNRRGFTGKEQKILDYLKQFDETQNQILLPAMSIMFSETTKLDSVFRKLNELVENRHVTPPNVTRNMELTIGDQTFKPDNVLNFSEFIDGLYERKMSSRKEKPELTKERTSDTPIFNNNGIKIYDANDKNKCIIYTQGGVTGKKYSFCIGQYINNMYQSYRDNRVSTFYFLVDQNRDFESDPLHIVVIDHTKNEFLLTDASNNTGTISEFGNNVGDYFNYLKTKGVNVDIFKHRPKSEEEKKEDKELGDEYHDLNWFKQLSYDYKSKYIGRGHQLGDEQFSYLWGDRKSKGFADLLKQYLNNGITISDNQFKLLTSDERIS
jgi:hypothetical protein